MKEHKEPRCFFTKKYQQVIFSRTAQKILTVLMFSYLINGYKIGSYNMNNKILLLTILILGMLLLVSIPDVSADLDDGDDDRCGVNNNWGYWMFPMMFLGMLVCFVVFIFLREEGPSRHESRTSPMRNSMHLLDERYARGDIPREEYIRMKDDLIK